MPDVYTVYVRVLVPILVSSQGHFMGNYFFIDLFLLFS